MHILVGESRECVQEGSGPTGGVDVHFVQTERTAEGRTATDLSSGYFPNK